MLYLLVQKPARKYDSYYCYVIHLDMHLENIFKDTMFLAKT